MDIEIMEIKPLICEFINVADKRSKYKNVFNLYILALKGLK